MHRCLAESRRRLLLLGLPCLLLAGNALAETTAPWLGSISALTSQDSRMHLEVPRAAVVAGPATNPVRAAASPVQRVLDLANQLRDIRYRKGGRTPSSGFDCSGFVSYVFNQGIGLSLPSTSAAQFEAGLGINRDELQSGDLVFFKTRGKRVSHVGIYLGDGEFIHAPSRGKRVSISRLSTPYWAHRYAGARRTETLAFAQDREALKPVAWKDQRLVSKASISPAALGRVLDITAGSPDVFSASSSMRMPR
ncbi:MAG: NlpC/P60 family protein [Dokdonella sp.]|nr:MAG: NlpC/P60 family protein [Dokdonella sp.]